MKIVESGARRDLGEPAAAIRTLEGRELRSRSRASWVPRLRYAYAEALLADGQADAAREWFERAAGVDADGYTDAAERLAELDGTTVIDTRRRRRASGSAGQPSTGSASADRRPRWRAARHDERQTGAPRRAEIACRQQTTMTTMPSTVETAARTQRGGPARPGGRAGRRSASCPAATRRHRAPDRRPRAGAPWPRSSPARRHHRLRGLDRAGPAHRCDGWEHGRAGRGRGVDPPPVLPRRDRPGQPGRGRGRRPASSADSKPRGCDLTRPSASRRRRPA